MKIFKFLTVFALSVLFFTACEDEEINYAFQDISAPSDVKAMFDITQDDTGTVTVTPSGEGAQMFQVYFGDVENETPEEVAPGESVTHVYDEGEYLVKVIAVGSTGLTSEFNQRLTIAFRAPENLIINVDQPASNPAKITVSASADYATLFEVYFGDVEDEEPTQLMPDGSIEHTYPAAGEYTLRVVAKGAGVATTEDTLTVVVPEADPAKLPITFDETNVNYTASTFGGTSYEVVTNPDLSGANTSESNVAAVTNSGGVWEGITYNLSEPVDFRGDNKTITLKMWSDVELPVLLKFEGGVNGERQTEVTATHTGTGWEELSFNFATDAVKSYVEGDPENGQAFVPTGQYGTMTIFIDGPGNTAGTFYLDDIMKQEVETDPFKFPVTFDSETVVYTNSGVAFEVVTNPEQSGINSSDTKVGAVTNAGSQYEAVTFTLDEPVDFSGDNKTVTMKVYSEIAYPVLLKFETGVNGERANEVEVNHGGTGWEELTFDFANDARKSYVDGDPENGQSFVPTGQYDQFSIFLDFAGTSAGVFYIDDIKMAGEEILDSPTTAAEVPTQADTDVTSIFSDSFTDPSAINYYPNWGQSTSFEMLTVDGNEIIKYSNANYQGIEFGEDIDATGYSTVHIDVWSGDYTTIQFYLISNGSGEKAVALNLTPNQWNSIEIPLSDFTSQGLPLDKIFQIKFDVQPDNGKTFYIDNLYFHN